LSYTTNQAFDKSTVFAGQTVGIREVEDKIWLVSFLNYDLGFFDENVGRVGPANDAPDTPDAR
jgi:hypothetical protein